MLVPGIKKEQQHHHSCMKISYTSILMLFSKRTPSSFIKTKIVPATYAAHLQCTIISKTSHGTLKSDQTNTKKFHTFEMDLEQSKL